MAADEELNQDQDEEKRTTPPEDEQTMVDGIYVPPGQPPPRITNDNVNNPHVERYLIDRFGAEYYAHLIAQQRPSIYKSNPHSVIAGHRIQAEYQQKYRSDPLAYLQNSRTKNQANFLSRQNYVMQTKKRNSPTPSDLDIDMTGDTPDTSVDPADGGGGRGGVAVADGRGRGAAADGARGPLPADSEFADGEEKIDDAEDDGEEDENDESTEYTYISNRKNKIKVAYSDTGLLQTSVTVKVDKSGNQQFVVSFTHTSGLTHYVTGKYGHSKNIKNAQGFKTRAEAKKFLARFNYIILSQDGKADEAAELYRQYKLDYPNEKLEKLLPGVMEARKKGKRKPKVKPPPVSWEDSASIPMGGKKKKIIRDPILVRGAKAEQDPNDMLFMYLPDKSKNDDPEEQADLDAAKERFLKFRQDLLLMFFESDTDPEEYDLEELDFAISPEGLEAIEKALFIRSLRANPGMRKADQEKAKKETQEEAKKLHDRLRQKRRKVALRRKRYFLLPEKVRKLYDQVVTTAKRAQSDDDPTLIAAMKKVFLEG